MVEDAGSELNNHQDILGQDRVWQFEIGLQAIDREPS